MDTCLCVTAVRKEAFKHHIAPLILAARSNPGSTNAWPKLS
jgi:hypothetical protein